jgi:hypothetical protein
VTQINSHDRTVFETQLIKRYESGESIRVLAASIGRSYGFVRGILAKHAVPLRPRGAVRRQRTAKPASGPRVRSGSVAAPMKPAHQVDQAQSVAKADSKPPKQSKTKKPAKVKKNRNSKDQSSTDPKAGKRSAEPAPTKVDVPKDQKISAKDLAAKKTKKDRKKANDRKAAKKPAEPAGKKTKDSKKSSKSKKK